MSDASDLPPPPPPRVVPVRLPLPPPPPPPPRGGGVWRVLFALLLIASLGLNWKSFGRGILTDGSLCLFDVYVAKVVWDG